MILNYVTQDDKIMLDEIFSAVGFDEADNLVFVFYDVTFKRDFGPWKANQQIGGLNVDLNKGIFEEFNDEGNKIINQCKVNLIALS